MWPFPSLSLGPWYVYILSLILALVCLGGVISLLRLGFLAGMTLTFSLSSLTRWGYHRLFAIAPTTFGSARLARPTELHALQSTAPGHVLGQRQGMPLVTQAAGTHLLVMAPPDGGKSTGPIACTLLSTTSSCVVLDPKNELYEWTAAYRQRQGQRIYRFAPTEAESCGINLLDLVRLDSPYAVADARTLAMSLVNPPLGDAARGESAYWQDSAVSLLSVVILYVLHHHPRRSLAGCREVLVDPKRPVSNPADPHDTNTLLAAMKASPHAVVRQGGQEQSQKSDRDAAGVLSETLRSLAWVSETYVAAATDRSDLDLQALQTSPMTLYIHVSPGALARLHPLVRAVVEMTLYRLTEQSPDWHTQDCLWVLDEVAALGTMGVLTRALPIMRGYGLKALLCFQDYPQLLRIWGPHHSMMAVCGVQWYARPSDDATAEMLSKRLGQTTIARQTISTAYGPLGIFQGETTSEAQSARHVMLADEVRQLSPDHAILITPGRRPAIVEKIAYWQHPTFAARAALEPEPVLRVQTYTLRRVAAVAGALLLAGSVGVWALWPTPETSRPTLSLTSETPRPAYQPPAEAGAGLAAPAARDVNADPTPERFTLNWSDRLQIRERTHYGLYTSISPSPMGPGPYVHSDAFGGGFQTLEACEVSRQRRLTLAHQQVAQQGPGQTYYRRLPNGIESGSGTSLRRETWLCAFVEDGPS